MIILVIGRYLLSYGVFIGYKFARAGIDFVEAVPRRCC
jgi:hypothetical protein